MLAAAANGKILGLAAGLPAWVTQGMTPISTQTASNSASLVWTGLTGFDKYLLVFENILASAASSILYAQMGTGAGPTYLSSGDVNQLFYSYGASTTTVTNNTSVIYLAGYGAYVGVSGVGGAFGHAIFSAMTSGAYASVDLKSGSHYGASNLEQDLNCVSINAGAAITAIKLYMSGGNIASGSATLFGIAT